MQQIIAYDYDVIIMGKLQDVEEEFSSLVEQTNKMGLERNGKKTEFLIIS